MGIINLPAAVSKLLVDNLPCRGLFEVDLLSGGFALLDDFLNIEWLGLNKALRGVKAGAKSLLFLLGLVGELFPCRAVLGSCRARCSAVCLARAFFLPLLFLCSLRQQIRICWSAGLGALDDSRCIWQHEMRLDAIALDNVFSVLKPHERECCR